MQSRTVLRIFTATRQREGAGFIVAQPIPHRQLRDHDADPFLMLHAFGPVMVDHRSPGAPWHPHRGFDTVTYILQGESQHQDSMGNKGMIRAGEVQWMRAGSGVVHDEGSRMARDDPARPSEGFQIWVNLPSTMKMSSPDYRQLTAETFVWHAYDQLGSTGTRVKIIAGRFHADNEDVKGAVESPLNEALAIPVLIADVRIAPGGIARLPLDEEMETAIVYVFRGAGRVFNGGLDTQGTIVKRDDCAVFKTTEGAGDKTFLHLAALQADEYKVTTDEAVPATTSDDLEAEALNHRGMSVLVLAGKRIREPIARHGPFVMNTDAELQQAFMDYHAGKLASVKGKETAY